MISTSNCQNKKKKKKDFLFLAVVPVLKSNELKHGVEVQVQAFRSCILASLDLACFASGPRVPGLLELSRNFLSSLLTL